MAATNQHDSRVVSVSSGKKLYIEVDDRAGKDAPVIVCERCPIAAPFLFR